MSAYRRFLPRDGTRTSDYIPAEVAEAAEVKAIQEVRAAEAVLKPAEVRPRTHQLQQASARVQQQESYGIPELQQLQQLQQGPAERMREPKDSDAGSQMQPSRAGPQDGAARTGIPTAWLEGIARLTVMALPRNYPEYAWQQLIADAERFLDGWAAPAAALGWQDWELFGCHRRAPWGRVQGMGLLLLLHGRELVALTEAEAVTRTRTGARQTYRRKPAAPLHPDELALIWELDGAH
jgi:hypothetical protein